ncbi:MAG: CBS domain-containing protein [Nanoarchaeota archaeon]
MRTGFSVGDTMTQQPVTVAPSLSLADAATMMRQHHVGSLVIMDGRKLSGVLSEQDIVRKAVAEGLDCTDCRVSSIMETNLRTISPREDLYDALMTMRDLNIRHLPVLDNGGGMVGLLTLKDILKIQPNLFDLLVEKFEVREMERKPIFNKPDAEGICQLCGDYAERLSDINSTLVCGMCKRLIS